MTTRKTLILLAVVSLLLLLSALMPRGIRAQPVLTISSIADITGDGAAHVLSASGQGRWVQIIPLRTNSADVRIGDSSVSATRGSAVAPGGGLKLQGPESGIAYLSLSSIYYYAANGDKISVTWGN